MTEYIEIIECRDCESKNCDGCNILTLAEMLNNGAFDGMMDEHHCIIPAADVAPVVHGEWEIILDDFDCEFMRCSCCGEEFYNGDEDTIDQLHNYCPNCGAKMDE